MRFSAALFVFALGPNLIAAEPQQAWDRIDRYDERRVEGWRVLVHKVLSENDNIELRDHVLKLLDAQLYQITRVVPAGPLAKLQAIPIWVEKAHPRHPCMCYHPSPDWLREHGMNPQKAGAVEIANCKNFLSWTKQQPWMVLHELAHGYHHQVLGHDHAGLIACYERAKESKSYESVLHINGRKVKHYALNNVMEYFAEGTEAFFGTNDYYPFVRAELRQHDPALFELLEQVWQVRTADGAKKN